MADRLRSSLRLRITLVAVLAVGSALAGGGFALKTLTETSLRTAAEASAVARSRDLADLISQGVVLNPIRAGRSGLSAQILDSSGRVVASTPDIEGQEPIVTTLPSAGGTAIVEVPSLDAAQDGGSASSDDDPYLVAVTATDAEPPLYAAVGMSLGPIGDTTDALQPLLLIGIPLLVLVTGGVVWLVVRWSLREVDAMRAEAAAISIHEIERRLPVPPGTDEFHRLAETFNQLLDRLTGALDRQRRFVADASHELKSPVAALRTMVDVALGHPETVSTRQLAGDLSGEVTRLHGIVDDLLTLSAGDEGRMDIRIADARLDMLIHEEAASLEARSDLRVVTEAEPVTAAVDPTRMRQVIRNLSDNASRYARSVVWFSSTTEANTAVIQVADDGPGVAAGGEERIFERFVRLDDARTRRVGGSGLGLAVVKEIVEQHGGTVAAIRRDDRPGAVIEVRLPLGPTRNAAQP